jgi:hypothetical protein
MLSAYYDLFAPGGRDVLAEWQFSPGRSVDALVLYRDHAVTEPAHETGDQALNGPDDVMSTAHIRCQVGFRLSRAWTFRVRAERATLAWRFSARREAGFAFSQEFEARPSAKWRGDVRVTMFGTGSFATRIALPVRDLPGVFSLPSMEGTGASWYVLVACAPWPSLLFSVRFSDGRYDGTGEARATQAATFGAQIEAGF